MDALMGLMVSKYLLPLGVAILVMLLKRYLPGLDFKGLGIPALGVGGAVLSEGMGVSDVGGMANGGIMGLAGIGLARSGLLDAIGEFMETYGPESE